MSGIDDLPVIHPAHTRARSVVEGEELASVSDIVERLVYVALGVGLLTASAVVAVYNHYFISAALGAGSLFFLWVIGRSERLLLTSEGIYWLRRERSFGPELAVLSMPITELYHVRHTVESRHLSGGQGYYSVDVLHIRSRKSGGFRFEDQHLLSSQIRRLAEALAARGIGFEKE